MIENIYAGPHGSFVPKTFSAYWAMQAQAEIGFIVVQIDGMGTSTARRPSTTWRGRTSPTRASRIGSCGTRPPPPRSLLRHHVVSASTAIRRRPERAGRAALPSRVLQGGGVIRRLPRQPDGQDLVERAVDGLADRRSTRLPRTWTTRGGSRATGCCSWSGSSTPTSIPSSTMQVVHALIRAEKERSTCWSFPAPDHAAGRSDKDAAYGERKRFDFFVQHLLGQLPPDLEPGSGAPAPLGGTSHGTAPGRRALGAQRPAKSKGRLDRRRRDRLGSQAQMNSVAGRGQLRLNSWWRRQHNLASLPR